MANVIDLSGYASGGRGAGLFARLRGALAEHREFLALRSELNALSDRDLADIGISRLNIDDLARQSMRR